MPQIQARVIHAMTIPFTVQLVTGPGTTGTDATAPDATAPHAAGRSATAPAAASTTPTAPPAHPTTGTGSPSSAPTPALSPLLDSVMPKIAAWLDHVDRAFSPFRADSLVGRARRGDWSALLTDPEFAEVYALCQQAKRLTGGAFDSMHAGVYDPTGIVKGWAVQRAFERFLQPLIRDGQCEAAAIGGGGDIQTGVAETSGFVWRIGVENPFRTGRTSPLHGSASPRSEASIPLEETALAATSANAGVDGVTARSDSYSRGQTRSGATATPADGAFPTLCTVSLRNAGIATSGTAKRGEHITRRDHGLAQATVIDAELIFADMWATAAISAGEAAFRESTARSGGDVTAILVGTDRSIGHVP
ncbi:FAD:protein FMN transferase [Bifidobacterium leontopitheci]|uniref:FAD:protein FMN transferase n=1 Tax=Bifidobacterium leontopitheci TaxID=2650774 RepID=A0A6I1GTZ6_9BIFI|nr:FAD:protein FMN transferase [Bifidobacterium leontopitheci]KAB7789931.1 ApbE family [Bifidobacterium leontopitheci]